VGVSTSYRISNVPIETRRQTGRGRAKSLIDYARQSDLPPFEAWEGDPLRVTTSQRAKHITYSQSFGSLKSLHCLPTDGSAIHISGNLFEGKLITRIRDDNNNHTSNSYFRQRSRQYNWIVQGRFLQRTRFDEVITGQDFDRPFRNLPSSHIVQRLLDMLPLPDSFECDFLTDKPSFHHPLLAGCQHFRIDKAEDLSNIATEDELHGIGADMNVQEDTALLNDENIPRDGPGRKRFFSKSSNLSRFFFEPALIYTFDFYSNFFSPTKYSLEMGPFLSIDLIPYFNGLPLFLSMAKIKSSGEFLWATECWHKRLLNYHETPGRLARWCW
jgi:hypothetical protein